MVKSADGDVIISALDLFKHLIAKDHGFRKAIKGAFEGIKSSILTNNEEEQNGNSARNYRDLRFLKV